MPTEKLKQALRSANVGNAEKDLAEVISRMFDIQIELAYRVIYAVQAAELPAHIDETMLAEPLRRAIRKQVQEGERRVQVRCAIENGNTLSIQIPAMVPEATPNLVCIGCPKSLQCVAESLHEPRVCQDGEGPFGGYRPALPIQFRNGVITVECAHPQGTFTVGLEDIE